MAAKKAKDEEAKKPKKAPASKAKETKAKAPAKEKAPAKAKKEKAEVPAGPKKFSARSVMLDELAEIEKKSDLVSHGFGRYCKRLSTGVLAVDMYLDGGLIPGGWYTVAGPEQSAKSTLTMTLVAACVKQAFSGYGALFDYEGSSDIDYIMNMFRNFGIKNADHAAIFGIQDPESGDYIKEGIFRYYDPDNGEKFFSYMSMMRRRLPDKIITEKGEPFLIFDNNKKNQKKLAGHYDPKFFREKNKFKVPAEDTSMQSLTVVDSYPAMLPDQMDDDDPSGAMALQARMFSDGIKRFRGGMRRKMMTILGVNQLRERPAQQHGDPNYEPCFIGSTPVHLADGTVDTIRNIVLKRRDVEVLSFDKVTGEVSAKRIIDWKDNGNKLTEDLVVVQYQAFDHNGCPKVAEFTCTKDHKVWTPMGWEKAGNLRADSVIYLNVPSDSYSTDQQQVIYGALLGDGSFDCAEGSLGWNVTFNHVRYQVPYMLWKAQVIDFGDVYDIPNDSNVQRYKPSGEKSGFTTFKHFNPEVAEFARVLKSNHTKYGKEQIAAAKSVLELLDLRGLAVWYMDDGHFANDRKNGLWVMTLSCDRFNDDLKAKAIDVIEKLTGVRATVHASHGKLFISGKEDCLKFQDAISDYMHPSMSYKLFECASAGGYRWRMRDPKVVDTLHETKVVSVGPTDIKSKYTRVYDLTVEDNHNYFVGGSARNCDLTESRVRRSVRADGVAVSNCGNALKFYCVHNSTEVRYLNEDGDECVMSAREYFEAYAEVPREERPPIRVPNDAGWLIPDEVFETDGSNFSVRSTYEMFTESGHVIRGSAGHSVLTATPLVAMHPWGDDDAACREFDLPNKGQLNELEERKRDFSKKTMRIPRIGWSRLINIDARKRSFAFVEANGLDAKAWRAGWNDFILAMAPELAEFIASVREFADMPIDLLMREINGMTSEYAMEIISAYASSDPEEGCEDEYVTELYDIMFAQFAYIEELVNVYLQISDSNKLVPSRVTSVGEASAEYQLAKGETYIDFSVGGSWISSGIVSHNSDVRIRVMSRAIPPAFKGERGIVEEPSVEFLDKKRVDRYKFVSGRTIKNKLGGIPNQEFWIRIWEADGKGNARGVDPVYDVYFYLKTLNLLGGQRNKIKFLDPIPLSKARRGITWQELKILVLGTPSQIKELCADLDVKPISLRSWCFKFVSSEQGRQMVRDAVVSRVTAEADSGDDDDDDD